LAYSVIHVALQTEKVRDEQEHDMPLLQAISIVFERHPSLKYELSYTHMFFYMVNLVGWHKYLQMVTNFVDYKGLKVKSCNGVSAGSRRGLLLMQMRYL
jgi:hypothetical protein